MLSYFYLATEFDKKAGSSSPSTAIKKKKIFAPASPAFSKRGGVLPSAARQASLRPSETGMAIV